MIKILILYAVVEQAVTLRNDKVLSTFYHDHRADDAFRSCVYRKAIERRAKRTGDTVLMDSLGPGAALVWHLLELHGELTRREICALTGMTAGSVAGATRKLEAGGFLLVWQEAPRAPKVYMLHPDADLRLDERRPEMKSFGLGLRWQFHHAEQQLLEARRAGKPLRIERLAKRYNALHQVLYGDTGDSNPDGWVRGRVRKRSSRWDTWERQQQIDQLKAVYGEVHDLPAEVQRRWLAEAGYTEEDIRLIVSKRVFVTRTLASERSVRIPKDQQVERPPGLQPDERADLQEWIVQQVQS